MSSRPMDPGGTGDPHDPPTDAAPGSPAPGGGSELIRTWMTRTVIACAVLAMVGLVVLWPRGEAPDLGIQPTTYVDATVLAVDDRECPAVEADALTNCQRATVEITSGDQAGSEGEFLVRETDFSVPEINPGDEVVLLDVPTSPPPYRYAFSEFQRAVPMWGLLALFVAAVIFVGRWQGVRALAGLAGSGVILIAFVVPALIRDEAAVLVALTGCVLIAFLALYLAHGINPTTTVALAGTLVSLLIIVVLAIVAAELGRLSGLADSEAQALRVTAQALDLRGLLVAGMVVGALGVLDDVTVTQVSTVAALRRANPTLSRTALYGEAIRVGRDHVASTVNTLVLAYAGAALPLMLLFSQGGRSVGRILTSEVVGVEIVRMLVGSIGLILSVPITTALAATVLTSRDELHPGHSHGVDLSAVDGAASHGARPPASSADEDAVEPPPDRRRRTRRQPAWEDFGPEEDPI